MAAWGGFAFALITAAYALYYITVAHLDALQLVLVGTALETAYFVCEVPTGVLADTFSRRFSVIAGLLIVGVAWAGQGLIPTFAAIAGFEILRGVGEAFTHGATEAWIAGEVGDEAIGPLFLRETQFSQAAGFIGLPVGVGLRPIGIPIPVVLGGGLTAAPPRALILMIPEPPHPPPGSARAWCEARSAADRPLLAGR